MRCPKYPFAPVTATVIVPSGSPGSVALACDDAIAVGADEEDDDDEGAFEEEDNKGAFEEEDDEGAFEDEEDDEGALEEEEEEDDDEGALEEEALGDEDGDRAAARFPPPRAIAELV